MSFQHEKADGFPMELHCQKAVWKVTGCEVAQWTVLFSCPSINEWSDPLSHHS